MAAHSPSTASLHKYHETNGSHQDSFSDFVGILCQDGQGSGLPSHTNPRSPKVIYIILDNFIIIIKILKFTNNLDIQIYFLSSFWKQSIYIYML